MTAGDHQRAAELLPWLVNGTLQGRDLAWINVHLEQCAACRSEHQAQIVIRDALTTQPAVEFAPQPSFNRLWAQIETSTAPVAASSLARRPGRANSRWIVGALALQAAVIIALLAMVLRAPPGAPGGDYRTVTSAATRSTADSLQVVFDDGVTIGDVRSMLGRAGLTVSSGPTAAGVYVLVADGLNASLSLQKSLDLLRVDPRVRFADLAPVQ